MRVLVCGGRDFNDYAYVVTVLRALKLTKDDLIIHGAAKGADSLADKFALEENIPVKKYPAAWHLFGKSAGVVRNNRMLKEGEPDIVIAFPGGRGTEHMVKIATKAGITVLNNRDKNASV